MPANPRAASVRLRKLTGEGQRRHDFREGRQPTYVDADRRPENSVLLKPPAWREVCAIAEALRSRRLPPPKRAMKGNAARAHAGLITLGADMQPAFEALARTEQEEAMMAAARAVGDAVRAPLLWAVLHRDESAPHLHFAVSSFRDDGQALSKFLNRRSLSGLQDILHRTLRPWLPELERGNRVSERLAAGESREAVDGHRSVRSLHEGLGLAPGATADEVARARDALRQAVGDRRQAEADEAAIRQRIETLQREETAKATALNAMQARIDDAANLVDRAIAGRPPPYRTSVIGFGEQAWLADIRKDLTARFDESRKELDRRDAALEVCLEEIGRGTCSPAEDEGRWHVHDKPRFELLGKAGRMHPGPLGWGSRLWASLRRFAANAPAGLVGTLQTTVRRLKADIATLQGQVGERDRERDYLQGRVGELTEERDRAEAARAALADRIVDERAERQRLQQCLEQLQPRSDSSFSPG